MIFAPKGAAPQHRTDFHPLKTALHAHRQQLRVVVRQAAVQPQHACFMPTEALAHDSAHRCMPAHSHTQCCNDASAWYPTAAGGSVCTRDLCCAVIWQVRLFTLPARHTTRGCCAYCFKWLSLTGPLRFRDAYVTKPTRRVTDARVAVAAQLCIASKQQRCERRAAAAATLLASDRRIHGARGRPAAAAGGRAAAARGPGAGVPLHTRHCRMTQDA
jgi:hypothetical protein